MSNCCSCSQYNLLHLAGVFPELPLLVANTCGMLAKVCSLDVAEISRRARVQCVVVYPGCICEKSQCNESAFDGPPNGTPGLFCVRFVHVGSDLRGQAGPASGQIVHTWHCRQLCFLLFLESCVMGHNAGRHFVCYWQSQLNIVAHTINYSSNFPPPLSLLAIQAFDPDGASRVQNHYCSPPGLDFHVAFYPFGGESIGWHVLGAGSVIFRAETVSSSPQE